MTEEPYRWLEAINNRREYVREQLKGGSPVFAISLPDGVLVLGVGSGQSKVFEVFDRQAIAGLGHPADIEKLRQASIDAAHVEAFTRAPEDVTLRRLVGHGLSPQLKNNFEQIFTAPYLVEVLFAEVGATQEQDVLMRVHFDGSYRVETEGVAVATHQTDTEQAAKQWLKKELSGKTSQNAAAEVLLQAWWCLTNGKSLTENVPSESERKAGWRSAIQGREVEIGWLVRKSERAVRYQALNLQQLQL